LIINYTRRARAAITQRELDRSIGDELEQVPDIRYCSSTKTACARSSLVVNGPTANIVNTSPNELATQMKRIRSSQTWFGKPRSTGRASHPARATAARLGVSTKAVADRARSTSATRPPRLPSSTPGTAGYRFRVQLETRERNMRHDGAAWVPLGQPARRAAYRSRCRDIKLDRARPAFNRLHGKGQATCRRPRRLRRAGDATKMSTSCPCQEEPAEDRQVD